MKERKYGGAERAWEAREVKPSSWIMVGRKTGMELKATLQEKNIA